MKVGYARVSSRGQSLEVQIEKLRAAGCEKVFEEKRSGGKGTARPELAQALEYVREGDALIVTKLDRLARSLSDLSTITGTLSRKEVGFVVLDQAIDTTTPTGRLTFHLLGAIAEFERDLIAERRDEGIALAKNRGVKFGRKPKLTEKEKEALREAHRAGGTPAALMQRFGISKASFYRSIDVAKQQHAE
jgi:DNA invertase Pin-like site-specific DNA recombinase